MSLTLALALTGGVALLLLALHGWWSVQRLQRRRDAAAAALAEAGAPRPVIGERVEPVLDGTPSAFADTRPLEPAADPDAEPGADGAGAGAAHPPPRRQPRPETRLDALIDAIVPLPLDAPLAGEALVPHAAALRRAGSKPVHVEGLNADSGQWEPPQPGQSYRELQVGVQLASRTGPLNEIEYSEFAHKVQALADALGARAELPDMLEVVAAARELDARTSALDAQLGVTLRSNGVAWSVAYVQQLATRLGFVAGGVPGRFVLPAAEAAAPPVLVLTMASRAALAALDDDDPQAAAVRECTLSLDVPQTPEAIEAFPLFHLTATSLAADLDATAIDDAGQPITLQAYSAIGHELTQLYAQLAALDLAAGSAAARRLFS